MEKLLSQRDVGDKFISKSSKTVTEADLDMFCDITGMREDILSRDEVAQDIGLKARVVPGVMTFAVLMGLLGEVDHDALHVGTNNVKLLAPVYPNDKLGAECQVLTKRDTSKGDRIIVTYSWTVKNQDDVTVAQGENTEIFAK